MHAGDGQAHDPGGGEAAPREAAHRDRAQMEGEKEGHQRDDDGDEDGEADEEEIPVGHGSHTHRRHAGVVHRADAAAQEEPAHEPGPPAHRPPAHDEERTARRGDGDE